MGRAGGAPVRLTVYLDGRRVGWFTQRGGGDVSLEGADENEVDQASVYGGDERGYTDYPFLQD